MENAKNGETTEILECDQKLKNIKYEIVSLERNSCGHFKIGNHQKIRNYAIFVGRIAQYNHHVKFFCANLIAKNGHFRSKFPI